MQYELAAIFIAYILFAAETPVSAAWVNVFSLTKLNSKFVKVGTQQQQQPPIPS